MNSLAQIGLLDETLPTIDAVLDDLAYRVMLDRPDRSSAVGECAVTARLRAPVRWLSASNPACPYVHSRGTIQSTMRGREVLRACGACRVRLKRPNGPMRRWRYWTTRSRASRRVRVCMPNGRGCFCAWVSIERVSNLLVPTPDSVKRNPVWLEIAGFAMQGMGEAMLARQCADKALALDPQCARAWVLRGMLAVDDGDDAAAMAAFREARRRRSLVRDGTRPSRRAALGHGRPHAGMRRDRTGVHSGSHPPVDPGQLPRHGP